MLYVPSTSTPCESVHPPLLPQCDALAFPLCRYDAVCLVMQVSLDTGEDVFRFDVQSAAFRSIRNMFSVRKFFFNRLCPSLRGCIDCLVSTVDVQRCFDSQLFLFPRDPTQLQHIKPAADALVLASLPCTFQL